MPELPEVETTRIGIAPHLLGETVKQVIIRNHDLRWPISRQLPRQMKGQEIRAVKRRGKYIVVFTTGHSLILHLGMTGHLRILTEARAAEKHDHVDVVFNSGTILRFTDYRRFGCLLMTRNDPYQHALLASLGPEPLEPEFDADYLYHRSRGRKQAIKTFIMDSKIVVGVGNIYANEALFMAGINPKRMAQRITHGRYEKLVAAIKEVLTMALKQGGTTLRDFTDSEGQPGYFRHELQAYDRGGEPCVNCHQPIKHIRQGQRSTYYCTRCQR